MPSTSAGRVVGSGVTPGGERHAVLWRHGEAIDLGTLGGTTSEAYALNSRDQVVGYSTTADGQSHAFLWDDGVMHDLGAPVGDVASVATDIDDRGRVIGHAFEQNGRRAILWVTHLR